MTFAIEIEHLYKSFRSGKQTVQAVNDLSFTVPVGTVYGFLGHNGAGKSTTIRMLMGLAAPDAGDVRIFGQSVVRSTEVIQRLVGGFVDHATFYPFMTGRANLEVLARTSGCYQPARIEMLLDKVGVGEYADRPVRGYSTGMKQRLGIAAALLNDPDLVILDEPTNGLDPGGIQEIRRLIRRLVDDEGKTVLLSSHLLHEVEQACDQVAIIHRGKQISAGAVHTLLGGEQLKLAVNPVDRAVLLLGADYGVTHDDTWIYVRAAASETPTLLRKLLTAGIDVYQVVPHRLTLEEYFLTVVNGNGHAEPEQEAYHA
ncbi:MAG: ABC transporter ATP-binding protein [Anaerolineaceae bacterium]|nr:ABC transporter ATP-binding protein [Anaerolineaceae bacterium]